MATPDGRRQRRDRNREAVVEAVLDLIREGDLEPGADAVAARAGLSARSVFRYFDDLDDLCRAAIARQLQRVAPFLEAAVDVDGPLAERVADLVRQRVGLFGAMGNVGVMARLRAPFQPLVAAQLSAARQMLRERLRTALAPELDALDPTAADVVVAAADVMCSFESFLLLRDEHGRSAEEAATVLTAGVSALLAASGVRA